MSLYEELSKRPLKMTPCRVRRTYRGGSNIDRWRGNGIFSNDLPEEWVASTVEALNVGFAEIKREGLSVIEIDNGEIELSEIIKSNPKLFLGETHTKKYGDVMGILVKLIDSTERLSIQVHPDKAFAKSMFKSNYGKTEAWYFLDNINDKKEEGYILLGFKENVTNEIWEKAFYEQDIKGMVDCLHKIVPKSGDVFFIPAGIPHAIGENCFLLEIQEPTDYTLRTEKFDARGKDIPEQLIHQGIGYENMLKCFHYDSLSREEVIDRCKVIPKIDTFEDKSEVRLLIGKDTTECFEMYKISVKSEVLVCDELLINYSVAIVLSGKGSMEWESGEELIKQGDQFFIPATIKRLKLVNNDDECLEIIICKPPSQ